MTLLSVRALYKWSDGTLFDDMLLPSEMDRDALIGMILFECAELEVLIPEPDVFRDVLNYWSRTQIDAWNRMYDAMGMDYNPIWNKDGVIRETETSTNTGTKKTTGNTSVQEGESWSEDTDTDDEMSVAAFNAATLQKQSHEDITTGVDGTRSRDTGSNSTANEEQDASGSIERERVEQGNIGVTTTQFMLESEMQLRANFNVYNYIVESFKSRFCLLVY